MEGPCGPELRLPGRMGDSRKPGRSCVSPPSQPQDTGEGEPVPLSSGREPPFPPSPASPGASKMGMGSRALLGKESNFRTCAEGAGGRGRGVSGGCGGVEVPCLPRAPWCLSRRVARPGWLLRLGGDRDRAGGGGAGAGPVGGTGGSGSSLWMMDSQAWLTSW